MKQVTFRIIHFPKLHKYIGLAWNYDQAVLISTRNQNSYQDAKDQLQKDCAELHVELRWYDGDYDYDSNSGQLIPAAQPHMWNGDGVKMNQNI